MESWFRISSLNLPPFLCLTVLVEKQPGTPNGGSDKKGVTPKTNVTVYAPYSIEEEVTLVCLVTGPQPLKDYKISWSEHQGQQLQTYHVCSNTQEHNTSFVLMSVFKTDKTKWTSGQMFQCSFKSGNTTAAGAVSQRQDNSLEGAACLWMVAWASLHGNLLCVLWLPSATNLCDAIGLDCPACRCGSALCLCHSF